MTIQCLDIKDAAHTFVDLHDPSKIDIYYMHHAHGSIANYLDFEGSSIGDLGARYVEIDSHDSIDGTPHLVEWWENCYAVNYQYECSENSALLDTDWIKDFDEACSLVDDLKRQGYVEIGMTFWSDGNPQHCIDCYEEEI